jgi:hypothetical protein
LSDSKTQHYQEFCWVSFTFKKSLSETFKEFLGLIVFAKQERETGVHG